MTIPTTPELRGANGPPSSPAPTVVPIRPLVGSPQAPGAPADWLASVPSTSVALDDVDGWYQRALAVDSRTLDVHVVHLAQKHLSSSERDEIQALSGPADGRAAVAATWSVLVKAEQHVVTHAGIVYRVIQVGDLRVPVGGIGSVMTQLEWRGRGYARAVLDSATAFIGTQLWAPFALALCSREQTAFFVKLGWRVAEAPVWYERPDTVPAARVDGRALLAGIAAVYLPCQGAAEWPAGLIDVCGAPW